MRNRRATRASCEPKQHDFQTRSAVALWAAHIGISNLRPQHHGDAKDDPIFQNADKKPPARLLNALTHNALQWALRLRCDLGLGKRARAKRPAAAPMTVRLRCDLGLAATLGAKRPAAALVRRGLGSVRRCKTVWDLPPPPSIPDATSRISARRLIRFGPHV